MGGHGTEINVQQNDGGHHYQCQQGIIVVRDCPDKDGKTVLPLHKAGHGGSPGGNGGDNAYRGGGGIDQVCQLCPGNLMLVCYRPHNAAHS